MADKRERLRQDMSKAMGGELRPIPLESQKYHPLAQFLLQYLHIENSFENSLRLAKILGDGKSFSASQLNRLEDFQAKSGKPFVASHKDLTPIREALRLIRTEFSKK